MGALQQLVQRRRRRIREVEHLKEVLQTCWEQIYLFIYLIWSRR